MKIVSIKPNESVDVAVVSPSYDYDFMKTKRYTSQVRVGMGSEAMYLDAMDWANLKTAIDKAFEASDKMVAKENKALEADSDS